MLGLLATAAPFGLGLLAAWATPVVRARPAGLGAGLVVLAGTVAIGFAGAAGVPRPAAAVVRGRRHLCARRAAARLARARRGRGPPGGPPRPVAAPTIRSCPPAHCSCPAPPRPGAGARAHRSAGVRRQGGPGPQHVARRAAARGDRGDAGGGPDRRAGAGRGRRGGGARRHHRRDRPGGARVPGRPRRVPVDAGLQGLPQVVLHQPQRGGLPRHPGHHRDRGRRHRQHRRHRVHRRACTATPTPRSCAGDVDEESRLLVERTREATMRAIKAVRPGRELSTSSAG